MLRRNLLAVLLLALGGCLGSPVPIIVEPVTPPAPGPVDPPAPPAPIAGVVPYSTARAIVDGASRASVDASIGFPPVLDVAQDDGTTIVRWAAVGSHGTPRWLDVQFSGGLVVGHALIPRAP